MQDLFYFSQSGVIPYRIHDERLQILLITSVKKKRWIIPKGFVELRLTAFESAKKEAYEEAGIIGTGEDFELGSYEIQKQTGRIEVRVFPLLVTKLLDIYPDVNVRQRKWYNYEDAIGIVDNPLMAKLFHTLKEKVFN
ncbi:MAG: NUDIX hydrolase [Ignavibacteria bacterium]|nr:NUDIX hydrolase [Ignavibacteria bacterium]MDP3830919.1 NUDIX hydrolase [Ignavibacteriaceae bacterium]